jgi:hypothetical protein
MGIHDTYAFVELLDEMRGVDTDDGEYDYNLDELEEWLNETYGLGLEQAQDFLGKLIHFVPAVEGGMGTIFKGFAIEKEGTGRFLEKIRVES